MDLYQTPCFEDFELNRDLFEQYGIYMKTFEKDIPHQISNDQSFIVRLDGRAFHSFTRGLQKPFSPELRFCMVETAKHLAEKFNAKLAFVQSDEITLLFQYEVGPAEHMFGGKRDKFISLTAAEASVFFNDVIRQNIPEKSYMRPVFDSRIVRCDDSEIPLLNFRWRQMDCVRNAIAMIAQANISHKKLQGVNVRGQIEMLRDMGVMYEAFSEFERLGTFIRKVRVKKELSQEQIDRIPVQNRPAPGTMFDRCVVVEESIDLVSPLITFGDSAIAFDEYISSEDPSAKLIL